ncbi:hypothetical protein M153_21400012646 [Pseudoloma neurophilia]|uniref:Uncharacterized protein n=1 Tax=Pseudoloma neurophilia TaxID=146866 RepID=A0A0R0M332_9MICR|nr:hypothetical protein M153_21400012646 [Pseudoloma neurophilia]
MRKKSLIYFAVKSHYSLEIFADQNDIQINKEKINQKPSNMPNQNDIQIGTEGIDQKLSYMSNKNVVTKNTHSQMDLSLESYDINKNNQITENSIGNGMIATVIIGSLFFVSALFIGLGFLYKKYRNKTIETNPEDSKNVI